MILDEAGVDAIRNELGMPQQVLQEPDIGRDAFDPELAQRSIGLGNHIGKFRRRRVRDQLGQHRVEIGTGPIAGVGERIDPQTRAGRRLEGGDRPTRRLGRAIGAHRFHIDPDLHREPAGAWHLGLQQPELPERFAAGKLQLEFHQVDAGHFLGHGMLDLQARVRLDEREGGVAVVLRRINQELEGTQIVVADFLGEPNCRVNEPIA